MSRANRMKKARGIFICFVGIDGSGKSTLAQRMRGLLLDQGIASKYVWGAYDLYLLRPLVRMVQKAIMRHSGGYQDYRQYQHALERIGKAKFVFKIYQCLLLFEYLVEIFVKIRIPLFLGQNVVSDRYVFDTATNLAANFGFSFEEYRRLIDLLLSVCPKPDAVFYVDVPEEEVAMARKNDIPSIAYLENRRRYYRSIVSNYGMITLDGSSDLEELTAQLASSLEAWLSRG